MDIIKCTLRDRKAKPKQLRRDGKVPAIVYGKNLDQSISIQLDEAEINKFVKRNPVGSQITLDIDGEEYSTLLKNFTFVPLTTKLEHMDFQVLTAGETIKTEVEIHFLNKEQLPTAAVFQEFVSTIEYEVLPKDILDYVEYDVSEMTIGDDVKVSDLPMASDEAFHLITPINTTLATLVVPSEEPAETSDDAEEESVDVPVIGADQDDAEDAEETE